MAVDLVSLSDVLNEYTEEQVRDSLSSFTSPNKDVEYFLHDRCIQFEKVSVSRTTLVFTSFRGETVLAGYYAISSKPLTINRKNWHNLSKSMQRRLMPMGYKTEQDNYAVSSILLGQLGLNFQYRKYGILSGSELLASAYESIKAANAIIGGLVLYVEVDNEPHLRQFYTDNGFSQLITKSATETGDNKTVPYLTTNNQHLFIKKISDI